MLIILSHIKTQFLYIFSVFPIKGGLVRWLWETWPILFCNWGEAFDMCCLILRFRMKTKSIYFSPLIFLLPQLRDLNSATVLGHGCCQFCSTSIKCPFFKFLTKNHQAICPRRITIGLIFSLPTSKTFDLVDFILCSWCTIILKRCWNCSNKPSIYPQVIF